MPFVDISIIHHTHNVWISPASALLDADFTCETTGLPAKCKPFCGACFTARQCDFTCRRQISLSLTCRENPPPSLRSGHSPFAPRLKLRFAIACSIHHKQYIFACFRLFPTKSIGLCGVPRFMRRKGAKYPRYLDHPSLDVRSSSNFTCAAYDSAQTSLTRLACELHFGHSPKLHFNVQRKSPSLATLRTLPLCSRPTGGRVQNILDILTIHHLTCVARQTSLAPLTFRRKLHFHRWR